VLPPIILYNGSLSARNAAHRFPPISGDTRREDQGPAPLLSPVCRSRARCTHERNFASKWARATEHRGPTGDSRRDEWPPRLGRASGADGALLLLRLGIDVERAGVAGDHFL